MASYILPSQPSGTLIVNLQQSAFHHSLTHSGFQDLVPIKRRARQVEALLTQSSISEMLKCHTRKKTMFQTSAERLGGNTRHSATECFPRWPRTFFLPRLPGTLAMSRQSSMKRSVRQVEALLTQSSIREMLTSQDRKPCSRHLKRGSGETLDTLQNNAFQDGLSLSSFQDLLAP